MSRRCPFCKTELEECFDLGILFETRQLVSTNIWRCKNCPYTKNRFDARGKVIDVERLLPTGQDDENPWSPGVV